MTPSSLEDARALDAADPLRDLRARFRLPEGLIYLDGNSLGALPAETPERIADIVSRQWGERLIRSWNEEGWFEAPRRIGDKIARLIGAGEDEVVACDTTSANLFKLAIAAGQLRDGAIVAERDNFPSDAYVAAETARLLGREFRMVDGADIAAALQPDVAVAIVTHVNYRTGARCDMAALNAAARASGTKIVWDLSHSTGAVPLDLKRDGAEIAAGCGYKYLCGGPGAPAFLYVTKDLQPLLRSPIAGWWAHADPFAFDANFTGAPGIARFLSGTPPLLSLLALEAGIDVVLDADPQSVWAKSQALWAMFTDRLADGAPELALITSSEPEQRGSQMCFRHEHAYAIVQAAIARGVVGDFRAPDIARFGLTPLYIGFEDVWRATEAIIAVMRSAEWREPRFAARAAVT